MLRTQTERKDHFENKIIRRLAHIDPKDLPKIYSIIDSLSKKNEQDFNTRYQIENLLLNLEDSFKTLVNPNPLGGF